MPRVDVAPNAGNGSLPSLARRTGAALASAFNDRPAQFCATLLVAHVLLWSLLPLLIFRNLPLDLVENVAWSRDLALGYYKHPPLQVWIVWLTLELSGGVPRALFWLGPLSAAVAFIPVFLLGREAAGPRAGLLAVILLSVAFYTTVAVPEFNANVVQLPIWAFAGLALWRAIRRQDLSWWLALGLVLALAVHAKYSVAVLVASLLLAGLSLEEGRRALRTPGPYLTTGLALLVSVPHFLWLRHSGWLPLQYAAMRAEPLTWMRRLSNPLNFLATQAADFAAAILVLAVGVGLKPGREPPGGVSFASGPEIRRFVTWLAVAPTALALLLPIAAGHALQSMWGGPLLIWVTLAAVLWLRPAYRQGRLAAMLTVWMALFGLAPVICGAVSWIGPRIGEVPQRTAWPGAQLAAEATQAWHAVTGRPLTIVAGETWSSGLVSTYSPDRPSVYVDGEPRFNPWVSPARIAREGMLVVWTGDDPQPPPEYHAFAPFADTGTVQAPFAGRFGPHASLHYAVRLPTE